MSSLNILYVEDDPLAASAVQALVGQGGDRLAWEQSGRAGLQRAAADQFDVIILDRMLPDLDGLEVCRRIREWSEVPIIVLTVEGSEERKVMALDDGADDYVTKPFSFVALTARLRALLRRGRPERPAVIRIGDLEVDPAARRCRRGTTAVPLTAREFAVLEYLASRRGETVSKTEVLDHVWDDRFGGDINVVEVYISTLRRKIDTPFKRRTIHTVRGIGYRLEATNDTPT
jgi:DNA-binding response OmpR family regulator